MDYTPWANLDLLPHRRTEKQQLKITPPCVFDSPVLNYFNNDEVRSKLHIPSIAPEWDLCNTVVRILYDMNITGS
jgi:hypothetical protein